MNLFIIRMGKIPLPKISQNALTNKILLGSPQKELGGGNEVHSEKQDFRNRLEQRNAEAQRKLERPLTRYEKEDVES